MKETTCSSTRRRRDLAFAAYAKNGWNRSRHTAWTTTEDAVRSFSSVLIYHGHYSGEIRVHDAGMKEWKSERLAIMI